MCALNTSDEKAVGLWLDHKRKLADAWRTEAGQHRHFKEAEVAEAKAYAMLRFKAEMATQARARVVARWIVNLLFSNKHDQFKSKVI